MNENLLLTPDKDPMGRAIADYFAHGKAQRLRVFSSQFDEDEIPVKDLFRTRQHMSPLEQTALKQARGRILGLEVDAIDISPLSVEVMRQRGVHNALHANLFDPHFCASYDTILMLMNGSGVIGKINRLPHFFRRMKQLLRPGGQILMDSSDLRYLYEDEDGSVLIDLAADYYGEVDYRMQYKDTRGDTFDWLYIDFQTLSLYAADNGFKAELVAEGKHYDYLARLSQP